MEGQDEDEEEEGGRRSLFGKRKEEERQEWERLRCYKRMLESPRSHIIFY